MPGIIGWIRGEPPPEEDGEKAEAAGKLQSSSGASKLTQVECPGCHESFGLWSKWSCLWHLSGTQRGSALSTYVNSLKSLIHEACKKIWSLRFVTDRPLPPAASMLSGSCQRTCDRLVTVTHPLRRTCNAIKIL